MKNIISFLLALTVIGSTMITGYAQEDASETLTEYISEVFSETETETTTIKPATPVTTPGGFYKADVNLDGYINASDCRIILRFSAQMQLLSEQQCIIADINSNNAVNAQDARLALRMAAKIDSIIPDNEAHKADPEKYLSKYDNRKMYTPYLSGFKTNITDESVLIK